MGLNRVAMSNSRKKSRTPSKPKHTALGRRVIGALKEVLAHTRGEITLNSYTVPPGHMKAILPDVDVKP